MYAVTLVDTQSMPPRVVDHRTGEDPEALFDWMNDLDKAFYGELSNASIHFIRTRMNGKEHLEQEIALHRAGTPILTSGYVLCIEGPLEEGPQAA